MNGLKIVPIGTSPIHCHHCYIDLKPFDVRFVESFRKISNSFCKFSETPCDFKLENQTLKTPLETFKTCKKAAQVCSEEWLSKDL